MPLRNPRRIDVRHSAFPQPPAPPRLYRNIAFTFLGLTIAVVAAAIWMFAVRATVHVQVKRVAETLDTAVEIAKSPEQGQLQGRVVENTFDSIQEFPVKDRTDDAPLAVATTTGRVRIVNTYSKAQTLIKTTRLLTADGKLFRINANVNVPSGGSVEVGAYSDKTGGDYLIKTGTKFTIPGLWIDLQKFITAEAIADFSGEKSSKKTVTAADITDAQKTLEDSIVEQAKLTLAAEASVTPQSISADCPADQACWQAVYLVTPIETKSNATPGQVTDTFLAQEKVKVTAVYYPKKDMEALVRSKLKDKLPEGRDLADFDPGKVTYKLEQADASLEKARIAVSADAASRLTSNSPSLAAAAIAGLSVDDAKKKLSAVDGVEYVEIALRPSWARRLPGKDKIDLTIE